MKKILIEFAHPAFQKSRINRRLIEAIKDLPGVTFNDLYDQYPDFFIDVRREQELLLSHDIIVWHHPLYWYSAPALFKEWMDLVLEHGWAYGELGRSLENKTVLQVISTGGRKDVYSIAGNNRYTINEFLVPFRQSAGLCRMKYLPPFVIHGSHTMQDPEINDYAVAYRGALTMLRDGLIPEFNDLAVEYFNDIIDSYV